MQIIKDTYTTLLRSLFTICEYLVIVVFCRAYVRTSDGRQGWLPMSILMQTALSEDSSSTVHKPEDSHYRREYVYHFNIFMKRKTSIIYIICMGLSLKKISMIYVLHIHIIKEKGNKLSSKCFNLNFICNLITI